MGTDDEIVAIKKELEEQEIRIQSLESPAKGKGKRTLTKRKSITDHLSNLKLEGFSTSLRR